MTLGTVAVDFSPDELTFRLSNLYFDAERTCRIQGANVKLYFALGSGIEGPINRVLLL
jgi:hypothetical protein